jgi:hypothetical protein
MGADINCEASLIDGPSAVQRPLPRSGKWWSPGVDRATLSQLMCRRDFPGVV